MFEGDSADTRVYPLPGSLHGLSHQGPVHYHRGHAHLCLHVKVWWALPHGGEGQVMATVMEIKPTFEIFCISNIYEELLLPVLYARLLPLIIVITDRLFLYLYFVIVGKYIRYFRLSF